MSGARSRTSVVCLVLLLAIAGTACGVEGPASGIAAAAEADSGRGPHGSADRPHGEIDAVAFRQDMRRLWEDHITWTRLFIVSAIADLPDLDATAARLLQNQADIGEAVASFYGDAEGDQLTALLREHILIAGDVLAAAKAGDSDAVATASDRWYANADDIARFLADANQTWPYGTLRQMMRTHLDQTLTEATARLQGDWIADVAAYDEIHAHILEMADVLAHGIVEQFPDRFED